MCAAREFELVMVGNDGVGKSSLIKQYFHHTFSDEPSQTSFTTEERETGELSIGGNTCSFVVYDTGGQESFRRMTSTYYQDKHGVILVFDVTNQRSFDSITEGWWGDIDKYGNEKEGLEVVLVGNKNDLGSQRVVSPEVARALKDKYGFVDYIETSAKNNKGVDKAFEALVNFLYKRMHKQHKKCVVS